MGSSLRVLVTAAVVVVTGCATSRNPGGFVTADSSNDSSGNSSQPSENLSGQSSGSSRESSASSQSSNQSSAEGGSSDVNASSGRSSANSSNGSSRNSGQSSGVVSGVGLLLTTTVGTGFAIYGTVMAVKPKEATPPEVALRYLRANEDQLRQDLALGMGPTLDDLASAAEIRVENADRFRQLLQANREELLELADGQKLTATRALRFLSRIGELAWTDESLRQDAHEFGKRHAG